MNAQHQLGCNSFTDEQISALLQQHRAKSTVNNTLDQSAYRKAAVLVPLLCHNSEWHLLLTRRTDYVQDHKGQVSFPGGATDPEDATPEDTALREAFEEIGLPPANVTLLGRLPETVAPRTGFIITPVVSRIHWPFEQKLSANEVSRVFTIPLNWLVQSNNHREETMFIMGQRIEGVLFFTPYDGELLWGISARITMDLINILGLTN